MILAAALALVLQDAPDENRKRWLPPVRPVTVSGERKATDLMEEIRRQTQLAIETADVDGEARVTVDWKERPVLEALDDLCRALGRGNVGVTDRITLQGAAKRPHAVCHWRQFRAEVTDVAISAHRTLKGVTRGAHVTIALSAQPGTQPLAQGTVRIDEAVDDTGWSLLNAQAHEGDEEEGDDPNFVEFGNRALARDGEAWSPLSVELRAPATAARKIERLRGRIIMTFPEHHVSASVPAADLVKGKEIRLGPVTMTVVSFEQKAEKATLHLTITGRGEDFMFPQFEPVDAAGVAVGRGHSGSGSGDDYRLTYTLAGDAPVAALRYSAYVGRFRVAVPIDLRDIPLPPKE